MSLRFIATDPNFGLTVALVVFVMLTVILAAFIIALFASGGFRALVFRDKQKKKRRAAQKHADETTPPAARPAPRRPKKDDDGVPTIPLAMPPAQPQNDGGNKSSIYKSIREADTRKMTTAADMAGAEPKTFVPRTISPAPKRSAESERPAQDKAKRPAKPTKAKDDKAGSPGKKDK